MRKQYVILKLETKENVIPDVFDLTSTTEYFGVSDGYPFRHETLEQAEDYLSSNIYKCEEYTIITIYTDEQ